MEKNRESHKELLLFLLPNCNMTLEDAKSEQKEMTNKHSYKKCNHADFRVKQTEMLINSTFPLL